MNHNTHPFTLEQFETLLRRDIDPVAIDFERIWQRLDSRISNNQALDVTNEILKEKRDLTGAAWDTLESNLFRHIDEHEQYEQPIDECIRTSDADMVPPNQWERLERKLFGAIDTLRELPEWEQELKREQVPTEGFLERLESRVFARIDEHDLLVAGEKHSEKIIVFPLMRTLRIAAVLALSIFGVAATWQVYERYLAAVPTYAYITQGADRSQPLVGTQKSQRFESHPAGAIELGNMHGYARIRNGVTLQMQRATKQVVAYKLSFPHSDKPESIQGSADFFVNKSRARRSFRVETPDYTISVTGTFFKIASDIDGRTRTEVLEGSVLITLPDGKHFTVNAGESAQYNNGAATYVVRDGGRTIERDKVDRMPNIAHLAGYRELTVIANVPLAGVTVNERYHGQTPFTMLVPPGQHRVQVERDGYVALDTLVHMGEQELLVVQAALARPTLPHFDNTAPYVTAPAQRPASATAEMVWSGTKGGVETAPTPDLLAQARSARSWQQAVLLFERLADSTRLPVLVRETALFSIAQLHAENGALASTTKEHFLRYLTLFPSGTFAREALLRLAEIEVTVDTRKAIDYYLRYFEKYPTHYRISELQYRVGLLYAQTGDYAKSAEMIQLALESMLYDDPQLRGKMYDRLTDVLEKSGQRDAAAMVRERRGKN